MPAMYETVLTWTSSVIVVAQWQWHSAAKHKVIGVIPCCGSHIVRGAKCKSICVVRFGSMLSESRRRSKLIQSPAIWGSLVIQCAVLRHFAVQYSILAEQAQVSSNKSSSDMEGQHI